MSAISSATNGFENARALLELTSQRLSEGYITPEVVSAREMAKTQMDVQVSVLKEALAAGPPFLTY